MHFFIGQDKLTTQLQEDAYGPDSVDANTKFYVTSRFQLTQEARAFAVVAGEMIVQQSVEDVTLVNLIVKPKQSLKIPLDVQYYVYRGIKKSGLVNGTDIASDDSNANDLIKKIHAENPIDKSAKTIGYGDDLVVSDSVESVFNGSNNELDAIPVKEGEWIGNFTKDFKIGFEIVLSTNSSKSDFNYLRASKYSVDVSGYVADENDLAKKSKREEILNFIDPAAFFGLHYQKGVTYIDSNQTSQKVKKETLYDLLLINFHTKNKVYLDVRSEKGYSYNYYRNYLDTNSKSIQIGESTSPIASQAEEYYQNQWPIIIRKNAHITNENENKLHIRLRVDDNIDPIIYTKFKDYKVSEKNSEYTRDLLDGSSVEWTKEFQLKYPQKVNGTDKDNVATYIKLNYFRKKHSQSAPNTVFANEKYYDSAFCSIDIPSIGNIATLGQVPIPYIGDTILPTKHVQSAEPIYVREPKPTDNNDGTGDFQLNMINGAYWDDNRILFYATVQYENSRHVSEKEYLNTYSQKLNLDGGIYSDSELYKRTEIICKEYNTVNGVKRIPGLNFYRSTGTPKTDVSKNYKENALLLGLSIEELNSIKSDATHSTLHDRYIHLVPDFTTQPMDGDDPYFYYRIQIQGIVSSNQEVTRVDVSHNGNPIIVYSRDNQFFSSTDFSQNEPLTDPYDENHPKRIEFHIYHDGVVKLTDNIDLALVHDTKDISYFYHGEADAEVSEIGSLQLVMANKMSRVETGLGSIPPGFTEFINYDDENVPGVSASRSYENDDGDIVTDGVNGIRRYDNQGKKTFMVRLVNDSTTAPNGDITNFLRNTTIGFDLTYQGTLRVFGNVSLAAAVLGALIDVNLSIISGGFAYEKGSCYPSFEHTDGKALDTNYKSTALEDVNFILSLYKFGFTLFRISNTLNQRANDIYDHQSLAEINTLIFKRDPLCRRLKSGETADCNLINGAYTRKKDFNSLHSTHLHSTDVKLKNGEKFL